MKEVEDNMDIQLNYTNADDHELHIKITEQSKKGAEPRIMTCHIEIFQKYL